MKTHSKTALLFPVAYLAYACVYICRMNLSIAEPAMETAGLLTKPQYGLLGSAFFIAYSCGQLVNGYAGDKRNPRIMITAGLGAAGGCNLLLAALPPYWGIVLLWAVNGYAQSMIWGPLLREVCARCDEKYKQRIASLLISSVGVGSVAGILLATFALERFDVRAAFLIPGLLALAAAGTAFISLGPSKAAKPAAHMQLRGILRLPQMYRVLLPAMIHGVLKDNIVMWAPVFFLEAYRIDLKSMSFFALLVPLVGLLGRLAYPMVSRVCGEDEKKVSVLAFAVCVLALMPLCTGRLPAWAAALCLCVVSAAVSLVNTSLLSIYPMHFQSTGNVSSVAGLIDFVTYLGAGISSAFYGGLLAVGGYGVMFLSWAALSAAAIVLLLRIKRKKFIKT